MPAASADLVDIVRDFMDAHAALTRLSGQFREGRLQFGELTELIGDDDRSVLFRLKERCHALFRPRDAATTISTRGEVLFDLAVGSLFHEAMKFRESFYQQEIYGPRVSALRSGVEQNGDALFQEFEKILSLVSERLVEGMQETETLSNQTVDQLRVLLSEQSEGGVVARHLVENEEKVQVVFGCSLDHFFGEIEGSAAFGFEAAGRSYLESGFYSEAESALRGCIRRGGEPEILERLVRYAEGMAAYLSGDYARCVASLSEWFEEGRDDEKGLREIARAAVSKIGHLAEGPDREEVKVAAVALAARIQTPDRAADIAP
jgi:hypothetical protein